MAIHNTSRKSEGVRLRGPGAKVVLTDVGQAEGPEDSIHHSVKENVACMHGSREHIQTAVFMHV